MSKLHGIPPDDLRVLNSAEANLPFIGEKVFKFKVLNKQDGKVYRLTLDASERQLSSTKLEQLEQEEQSAYEAVYGKLHPALAAKLAVREGSGFSDT